jgi:hypothetical protein
MPCSRSGGEKVTCSHTTVDLYCAVYKAYYAASTKFSVCLACVEDMHCEYMVLAYIYQSVLSDRAAWGALRESAATTGMRSQRGRCYGM